MAKPFGKPVHHGRTLTKGLRLTIAGAALGLLLMVGGKSKDPNVFNPNEVYSFMRITVAPIFILAGLALEIVGIFKKSKGTDQ